ncbi:hypothetical protein KC19_4G054400 [Ceratodon purpureus]|uniref:Uncharacterized protein n=1 Tax=Ceratodon purpureus TaxID=3225 RepID=A0A8T0I5E8_CERPU|nr:hypothetical protein KC19_4G054400 [Ceratodon purpureus]
MAMRRTHKAAEKYVARLLCRHSHALAASPDERFQRYNSSGASATVDHSAILRSPQTRITTLANGMRVASESNLSAETATVGVWIDAGSRFETASTNGTAHFLEHMMFKGTKRRSQRQLEEEIENMGAHLNAFTSREHTAYFAKALKRDVPAALDILADILQNSAFNPSKIERERHVILREMQEVESQMQEVLFDRLHEAAFRYSSLGRTILGPPDNIETISRANLRNYIATHYTGPWMVVAAAGGVHHDDLVALAERSFRSIPNSSISAAEYVKDSPACFTGSEVRILSDELPLAHVAVAFEGASWTDPDSIALMIMQTMLGAWSKYHMADNHGSELAQDVGANDLAESFMAFNTNYRDSGLFGVYAVAKISWMIYLLVSCKRLHDWCTKSLLLMLPRLKTS